MPVKKNTLSETTKQIIREDFRSGVSAQMLCERYAISVKELQRIINSKNVGNVNNGFLID